MKKLLSVAALLMAVLMIAMCCAACGDDKNTDPTSAATQAGADVTTPAEDVTPGSIVGTWKLSLDFDKIIEATKEEALASVDDQQKEFMEEMFKCFNGVSMTMVMEYKEDGTYQSYVDETSAEAAFALIKENLKGLLPSMFEALGVSAEEMESQLTAAGYTMDSYVDLVFDQMDTSGLTDDMVTEGVYRLDGNKLYASGSDGEIDENSYAVVELSAGTLKVTEIVGQDSDNALFNEAFLPLVFTKA